MPRQTLLQGLPGGSRDGLSLPGRYLRRAIAKPVGAENVIHAPFPTL